MFPARIDAHDVVVVLVRDLDHLHGLGGRALVLRAAVAVLQAQPGVQILHRQLAPGHVSAENQTGRAAGELPIKHDRGELGNVSTEGI